MARKKLTQAEREKIYAAYMNTRNYSEVGRQFGIVPNTVKKIVHKMQIDDADFANRCEEVQEMRKQSILDTLQDETDNICLLIPKLINALGSDDKIAAAPYAHLFTVLKGLVEIATAEEAAKNDIEDMSFIAEAINGSE